MHLIPTGTPVVNLFFSFSAGCFLLSGCGNQAMSGISCRCGTYQRIRKAIHLAATPKQAGIK
jgi:hypothetical protein